MKGLDWVGWLSSLVLLATIGWQIFRQWREGSSRGVSRWLFAGQASAQTGFIIYSWWLGSWVFLFTNMALLLENFLGLLLTLRMKRNASSPQACR